MTILAATIGVEAGPVRRGFVPSRKALAAGTPSMVGRTENADGDVMLSRPKRESGEIRLYGRGTGIPDPVDVHVGSRIRMRRLLLGMNQETLADALGLTFQQVQKYEGGANRVSASRLSEMAKILGVPIQYFFGDLQAPGTAADPYDTERRERMQRPETIELIRLYYAITDQQIRHQFLDMVKSVAQSYSPNDG